MVCERHAAHAVGHGLVNEARDGGLPIEQGVVGVNVQVCEGDHKRSSGETVSKMKVFVKPDETCQRAKRILIRFVARKRVRNELFAVHLMGERRKVSKMWVGDLS